MNIRQQLCEAVSRGVGEAIRSAVENRISLDNTKTGTLRDKHNVENVTVVLQQYDTSLGTVGTSRLQFDCRGISQAPPFTRMSADLAAKYILSLFARREPTRGQDDNTSIRYMEGTLRVTTLKDEGGMVGFSFNAALVVDLKDFQYV